MEDTTETIRRKRQADLNQEQADRARLEQAYGRVWDTEQLRNEFDVIGFSAPLVVVKRLPDGVKGSLEFQHQPRLFQLAGARLMHKELTFEVKKQELKAVCFVSNNPPQARVKKFTEIMIFFGSIKVGQAKLGGPWTEGHALKEFLKSPERFGCKTWHSFKNSRTSVKVMLGPLTVATAELDGLHDEDQVKQIVRDRPELFQKTEDGWNAAVGLGLVPVACAA